jgi:cell wall-associated NlpC family hydrolase
MSLSAIADVQARITEISARFPMPAAAPVAPSAAAPSAEQTVDFAKVFEQARAAAAPALTPRVALATPRVEPPAAPAPSTAGQGVSGERAVEIAKRYLGVPYVWGGTDPDKGLDCSGLVQLVFRELGVKLPRVSVDQAKQGTPVASLAEAKPGDLVFWSGSPNHIGIYAGDNKMVVAPRTGDVVKIQEIKRTPTAIRRVIP